VVKIAFEAASFFPTFATPLINFIFTKAAIRLPYAINFRYGS
jgi:hypothetical protein